MNWRNELKTPGIQSRPSKSDSSSSGGASLWTKCLNCGTILYRVEIDRNDFVCLKCNYHFIMPARRRVDLYADPGSFVEFDVDMKSTDPLEFFDEKAYPDRLGASQKKSGENEAAIWGKASLDGQDFALGIFVFEFMGGSMGAVVGEKITRCFEYALENRIPAVVVSSSGGARMQEGILSLMQMAKTCAALQRLRKEGLVYVSVLAHPTTGGVAASFAMLGDVNIAEPEALIGFAGPRVIEQTIRQKLPEGFQRSNFLLKHGMIDNIVERKEQRRYLSRLFRICAHRLNKKAS
ncbi:MAG: acetyl-CoA carboxylase carboxyl transferase subunit beta [Deltaproteobacteria bacterium CG11_big_fil_rev_8_21_14_0_20_45_16]|nr:MAG: acetyl-CoA carboxylase carboxyl transferase subunit beta [Deltaproteobacteria bacterium CG11_big_fil_rev_8_21_14_0_20_45_16]